MALGCDCPTAWSLRLAITYILPECRCTLDGRLADLLMLPDVINRTIAGDGAEFLALRGARTVASVLLHIVFDERISGPAVDRDEDGAATSSCRALEGDVPIYSSRQSPHPHA